MANKLIQIELVDKPQNDGDRRDDLESDVDDLLEEAEEFLGKSNKTARPKAEPKVRREDAQPAEESIPSIEGLTNEERIMQAVEETARNSRQTKKAVGMIICSTRNSLEQLLESMGGQIPSQAANMLQGLLGSLYTVEKYLK
jgi:ElaB/YqjD/DUF883 family membrane-anchored ribosome-binding protein